VQMSNAIGMHLARMDEWQVPFLIIRGETDEEIRVASQEMRKPLGLNPAATELHQLGLVESIKSWQNKALRGEGLGPGNDIP